MTTVSVVITSLNEGALLRRTVDNLLGRLPAGGEIIVVDDQSTDGSTGFLNAPEYESVKVLRPVERQGVARARNFGAAAASGEFIVFSDAHVVVPENWWAPLAEVLVSPATGAVAPAVSNMRPSLESTGYGQRWQDEALGVSWLGKRQEAPYAVPLLCGCFVALRRAVFHEAGGFDSGMVVWGSEDTELSIRLWTCGYECKVVPAVDVQHLFREHFPYAVDWEPVLHNRLRLATVHFGPARLARVLARLRQYDQFGAASARLLTGDLAEHAGKVRGARRFDDDWFFDRFQAELGWPVASAKVESLPPVSACLVSWRRPQNLAPILQSLRALEFIDEILIWNNDPAIQLPYADSKVRILQDGTNHGCYGRFLCAAQARNAVVYVQDDDALNRDIPGLYRRYLNDPGCVTHALAQTHWPQRNRYVYGDAQSALIGWGAFFRKQWLSVLEEMPAEERASPVFRREADKYFTLLLDRRHNPVLAEIVHLDGHSTPGLALWLDQRRHQLAGLAIGDALRLLRLRSNSAAPVPWNVVIPCHNYARYLTEAVESVFTNDADTEIHIVDDASTDDTAEVAAELVETYRHVRYLRNAERMGPGHSRNRGIAAMESRFVVLLDADDKIGADYLYEAGRVLAGGADVVNPDAILFGAESSLWNTPESSTLPGLLHHNSVHYCSAFRRELWSAVGGIDEQMPCWMDYDFWIRMAAQGAKIRGIHGEHFFYRQHEANLTNAANNIRRELRAYIERKHANLFQSFGLSVAG